MEHPPLDARARYVRTPLRAGAAVSFTGAMVAARMVEERLRGMDDDRRDAYVKAWASVALPLLGVELVAAPGAYSLPKPPPEGRLVVSNHRSTVDILVLLRLFGGHLLSRADLGGWPVMGWLARFIGTLFVDRANASSGAASVRTMIDRLEAGRTVGVFPEGTTYPDDEVREFAPGAFLAVARTRGEVVPVGLAYEGGHATYFQEPIGAHGRRLLGAPKTRVAAAVGAAISAKGTPARALAKRAREDCQALVERARATL